MEEKNLSTLISIEIIRKKIKNMYLRVFPAQNLVQVSVPIKMAEKDIYAFVDAKSGWIKKHQAKVLATHHELEKNYSDGEIHYFNGRPYILRLIAHEGRSSVKLINETIAMFVHVSADKATKKLVLHRWYAKQLTIKAQELVSLWERKMNVTVKQIKIRQMKTRWGSCSPYSNTIRFNVELAKRSTSCLEYIVVHELTHLLEPSHNKRFVAFMNAFLPHWKDCKKELNTFHSA